MGRTTVWLDEVGAATRLKLVANSWIMALNVAVGETVALAQALDVAPGCSSRRSGRPGIPRTCT